MRKDKNIFCFLVLTAFLMVLGMGRAHAAGNVLLVPLTGTVGVQMEEFVQQTLQRARDGDYALAILQLDTPGGLVEAMRGIVQSILASRVPVAVWVPQGGRAASAGAFIVQAAHVAAMAPGTNIGAAHPVAASGEDVGEGEMSRKILNDLKAQMRSVVQLRDRNQRTAELMIEESLSLTAQEALEDGAIDLIAADLPSLLAAVNGRVAKLESGPVRIELPTGVSVQRAEMSWRERLIQFVSSPEIAYLLLSGGLAAIFFEIITPGGFVLGTVGGLMLLLGGIGLKMLPFSWAGVLLLGAGLLVMAIDLYVGGMGVLTLVGLPVFCLGGIFLFQAPGGELLRLSASAIIGVALALGLCFLFFAFLVVKGMKRKVETGLQGMVGLSVEVLSAVGAEAVGQVRCRGELWKARNAGGDVLNAGEQGIVQAVEGLTLVVRPSAGNGKGGN
ncbi:MAG: nodulation protein NfeD [Synergistaceae bacterium]|nr:nodulation protein NfeD [Synergistaceae bacterium]